MEKNLRKKIICSIIIFSIVFLFPFFYDFFGCVYANPVEPGTKFIIPSATEHPQYGGNLEADIYSLNWAYNVGKLYDTWLSLGGKATSDEGLCYIETGGEKWIFVATAGTYGEVGDYLQVHINHDGVETNYSMMIFDTKRDNAGIESAGTAGSEFAYYVDGIHYGHKTDGKLDILEFPWNGQVVSRPSGEFLNTMKDVTYIINGGNYFKNPEGPTGLTGPFKVFNGSGSNSSNGGIIDFTNFWGAIGGIFGGIWDAICVEFENIMQERQDITVCYDLNDKDDSGATSTNSMAGSRNGVVQYYQDDYGDYSYGTAGGTIATSGCGPTSVAMVVSTLTGQNITPKDVVDWAGNTYYQEGYGSTFGLYPAAAEHWGLKCQETDNIDDVVAALKEGKIVISSQLAGIFTQKGHLIVLTGIDNNGGISVNDPNKSNAENKEHNGIVGYNNSTFTPEEINASAQRYWIYSK